MSIAVVSLTRRHLRAVRAIDKESYPEPWTKRLWQAELEREDRWYLAALDGEEVVGHIGGLRALDDGHILTVAVGLRHRRQGVASRLVLALVRSAIDAGCTALTLEVRAGNVGALELYRRFGLVPAGVRRRYYEPNGEDAIVMWAHDIDGADYAERLTAIAAELAQTAPCR